MKRRADGSELYHVTAVTDENTVCHMQCEASSLEKLQCGNFVVISGCKIMPKGSDINMYVPCTAKVGNSIDVCVNLLVFSKHIFLFLATSVNYIQNMYTQFTKM